MSLTFRMAVCCGLLLMPPAARAQADGAESGEGGDAGNADDAGAVDDTSPDLPIPAQATGAGEPGPPVFTLDAHCADMHACLKVRAVRGKACKAADSVALEITNSCKRPVALGVCIEQADHMWNCTTKPKLAGGQTDKKAFTSCHGTGAFHALATSTADYTKQGCFLNVQGPHTVGAGGAAVPMPYLGVCARVKMCCRALESLPGADSLAQACDALDALPDNVGVEACAEILNVMRREVSKVSGTPAVCH